jgi:uncharacterized protein (DUF58 family)
VESLFPLGLFRARAGIPSDPVCLVYPRPVHGRPLLFSGAPGGDSGPEKASENPGADDFQGLLPYQPGHRVRRIAWKALSRGQGLFVKNFTLDGERPVMLDFDSLPSGDTEHRLSVLCGMVLRASAMDLEYGLGLPGTNLEPGRGDSHRQACLKALALFDSDGEAP